MLTKATDLASLSCQERLPFFVNLYKMIMVHSIVALGEQVRSRSNDRSRMLTSCTYVIGDHQYTPHDILNGILRANRKTGSATEKHFKEGDARAALALKLCDLRVHFALFYATHSSPPLRVYSASKIDMQLNAAVRMFLSTDKACTVSTTNRPRSGSMLSSAGTGLTLARTV